MRGCQALVHAAADTDHGRGTGQTEDRTNLEGTRNVFQAALTAGISRAVHISTELVLLDGRPLINATEEHPFPRKPAGTYSRTKGEAERIAPPSLPKVLLLSRRPDSSGARDDTTALPKIAAMAKAGKLAWPDGGHY